MTGTRPGGKSVGPRTRTAVLNAGLAVFSLLIAASLGEAFLRVRLPFEEKRRTYMRSRHVFQYEPANIRWDPELGFACRPNLSARFNNDEYRTRVLTNSEGFRDDEASIADPRLILLGDSFFFGWGVNKEESIESGLESLTGARALNMAVPGYATSQEYLLLKRWSGSHPLRGTVVIVQFYGNDIPGMDHKPGDIFPAVSEGPGGTVAFSPVPEPAVGLMIANANGAMNHGIARWSYLADFAGQWRVRIANKWERIRHRPPAVLAAGDPGDAQAEQAGAPGAVPPIRLVVRALRALADAEGFHLLFVYVPSVRFYEGKLDYDEKALAALEPALSESSVAWIDLRPVLGRGDYYGKDDHWNRSGHAKAARAIAERLRTEGWAAR